jgi:hypothetical protein
MYEKPETRDVMTKTNPDGKHDEVNVVRERGNVRQGQAEQLLKVLGYKFIADEQDLQRGAQEDRFNRDTVRHGDDHDVINVEKLSSQSMRTPVGESAIKFFADTAVKNSHDKYPGKDKAHEKPELEISFRVMFLSIKFGNDEMMTDINPEGKHDEDVNMGNVNNLVDKNNVEKLSRQLTRPMGEPVIESFGYTAFENTLDKDPGKDKVHEKPEERDVVVNIIDAVMLNMEYEAGSKVHQGRELNIIDAVMLNIYEKPETRDGILKTIPKGKYDKNVNHLMDENNAVKKPTEAGSSTCTRSL